MITVKVSPSLQVQSPPLIELPPTFDQTNVTGAQLREVIEQSLSSVVNSDEAVVVPTAEDHLAVSSDSRLERFFKMLSLGVPPASVAIKMRNEGFGDADVDIVVTASSDNHSSSSSSRHLTKPVPYGICANQGCVWVDWKVKEASSRLVFGVCSAIVVPGESAPNHSW